MLGIAGQPSESLWAHHENWWNNARQKWNNALKTQQDQPDWPQLVWWRSKTFMAVYMKVLTEVITNPSRPSLEGLMWDFTVMRNALLDLKLVSETDLQGKANNLFQKIAKTGNLIDYYYIF